MSPRVKLVSLWTIALVGPLASGYCVLSAVFYAWLNASGSWSAQRASAWSGSAFVLACFFAAMSAVAIVKLVRYYNALPPLSDAENQ